MVNFDNLQINYNYVAVTVKCFTIDNISANDKLIIINKCINQLIHKSINIANTETYTLIIVGDFGVLIIGHNDCVNFKYDNQYKITIWNDVSKCTYDDYKQVADILNRERFSVFRIIDIISKMFIVNHDDIARLMLEYEQSSKEVNELQSFDKE